LSLKSNSLRADGGKALAEGLKCNQVITELNISDNNLGDSGYAMSGIIALAGVIPDMGALLVLSLGGNCFSAEGGRALAAGLKGNQVITELNASNNELGHNSMLTADPSGIMSYGYCRCHPRYGGTIGVVFERQQASHYRWWEGFGPRFGQQFYSKGVGRVKQQLDGVWYIRRLNG
jgi:hypothetical protein